MLPDAADVATFWENLKRGHCSIREVPPDRWDPGLFFGGRDDVDRTYSKIGAFVRDYKPDARQLRIPPKVLQAMDPAQLWVLEAAQQAIKDAGYDRRPFDRRRCGVVLGATSSEEIRVPSSIRTFRPIIRATLERTPYVQSMDPMARARLLAEFDDTYRADFPPVTEDTMPGELANITSGRLANMLDLAGKNYTTDAACASSAAALDVALHTLDSRECDMVITGGVDRNQGISTYIKFCRIGALSASGSRPFDASADGFVMGEGAVVFLLKRLDDALRDGDRIHAVLRGLGSSSDGKGKGILAPSVAGQTEALLRAYDAAGVRPSEIDFLECHGTGTMIGDAAELETLRRVFAGRPKGALSIGSVKSNIGHLKGAAAAAGLLKAVLAVRDGVLPPSLGFSRPNPYVPSEGSPFRVQEALEPWSTSASRPRLAGVSSFGFGGTNFHLVVEEPPREEKLLWPLLVA